MFSAFFYLMTSKFTLYKRITSILKMKNKICFQSVSVSIMRYVTLIIKSICFKVSNAHLLKNETESLQLG